MTEKRRTAIITGAAQGIGLAIARRLSREGIQVVLADIKEEEAKKQARLISQEGKEAMGLYGNVASLDSIEEMFSRTTERFGGFDILVNNAGILFSTPIREITEKEWDLVHAVNLKGVFFCMQKALPYLGVAEDIAAAVAFLAQEDTDFITGEAISVNGGMYCG